MTALTVAAWLSQLSESGIACRSLNPSANLNRQITSPHLHRPGLSLVGHFFHHHPERVQVLGETELTFLAERQSSSDLAILDAFTSKGMPALVVTKRLTPPASLLAAASRYDLPTLQSDLDTGDFIREAGNLLADLLAPSTILHGVMVDIFGVGVLIMGPSGIGKSECALELVLRGHRLVADDMVEIRRRERDNLICRSMELIKHHMEIRGLGIINVQDLFGVAAVRDQKKLELIVTLEHWNPDAYYDRLGSDEISKSEILGVAIDEVKVPVRAGRNLSDIIEIAARNRLLKIRGVDSAKRFQDKLLSEITNATSNTPAKLKSPLAPDSE